MIILFWACWPSSENTAEKKGDYKEIRNKNCMTRDYMTVVHCMRDVTLNDQD